MDNPYEAQIRAGVAWLDEHYPDWVKVFAADKAAGLHMANCHLCVLGYVLGSYWAEGSPVYDLGAKNVSPLADRAAFMTDRKLANAAAYPLGFAVEWDGGEEAWDTLGRGWREVIEERLAAAGLLSA